MAQSEVVLNRAAFKEALTRVINDKQFAQGMEEHPGTALKSLGFQFSESQVKQIDSVPLSQTIQKTIGNRGPVGAETYVHVVVDVIVEVAVRTEIPIPFTVEGFDQVTTALEHKGVTFK